MLMGDTVHLRARVAADVPVLQAGLYDDVATRVRADGRPWRPVSPGSAASPYAVQEPSDGVSAFSVVETEPAQLAGEALLWGIDAYNRTANIGLALLPAARGRGLGGSALRVLCEYGFLVLGLHRLQIDTLSDNEAMLRAARRLGFAVEGVRRHSAWVWGAFEDETVLGLLAHEHA